jgi:hypothetical protein
MLVVDSPDLAPDLVADLLLIRLESVAAMQLALQASLPRDEVAQGIRLRCGNRARGREQLGDVVSLGGLLQLGGVRGDQALDQGLGARLPKRFQAKLICQCEQRQGILRVDLRVGPGDGRRCQAGEPDTPHSTRQGSTYLPRIVAAAQVERELDRGDRVLLQRVLTLALLG